LALDAAKGAVAVGLTLGSFALGFVDDQHSKGLLGAFAAMCAIAGHMFPVWLGFRGGKGVATAAGAILVLAPWATHTRLGIFIVVVRLTRYVWLGSILAVGLFPVAVSYFGPDRSSSYLLLVSASPLLTIVKHHENIRRLLSGTENKFSRVPSAGEMERHA